MRKNKFEHCNYSIKDSLIFIAKDINSDISIILGIGAAFVIGDTVYDAGFGILATVGFSCIAVCMVILMILGSIEILERNK